MQLGHPPLSAQHERLQQLLTQQERLQQERLQQSLAVLAPLLLRLALALQLLSLALETAQEQLSAQPLLSLSAQPLRSQLSAQPSLSAQPRAPAGSCLEPPLHRLSTGSCVESYPDGQHVVIEGGKNTVGEGTYARVNISHTLVSKSRG